MPGRVLGGASRRRKMGLASRGGVKKSVNEAGAGAKFSIGRLAAEASLLHGMWLSLERKWGFM